MKTKIHKLEVPSRMSWECGDHTGTITFPDDERGPVDIEWDNDCPDNWEGIEAKVAAVAIDYLANGELNHE